MPYRVLVQMPLELWDDAVAIVETELELPDIWRPVQGQWIFHPVLDGLNMISTVCYDASQGKLIICMAGRAKDPTSTIAEWLKTHKNWKIPKNRLLDIYQLNKDGSGYTKKELPSDQSEDPNGP